MTLACFQDWGNLPWRKLLLNKSAKGSDNDIAASFSILLLIRSGPQALLVSRWFRIL